HTRFSRDWSSDVCSSDLFPFFLEIGQGTDHHGLRPLIAQGIGQLLPGDYPVPLHPLRGHGDQLRQKEILFQVLVDRMEIFGNMRSEERRVGKECRNRTSW